MKPKKSLGQHFLKSEKVLAQIIAAGDIHADDIVLEIGPGQGVLTEKLLKLAGKVIAVEKDRELIPLLEEKFSKEIKEGKFDIIEKDILSFDPEVLRFYNNPYKLVANIPYYITGAILEQFLSAQAQPESMTLLVQKEVAERIVSRDKKESILSLSVKAYGTPKIIAKVPAGAFNPPPKVDSAILQIENISRNFFKDLPAHAGCDEALFFKLIKASFAGKRKQLGGTLTGFLGEKEDAIHALNTAHIDQKTRPEDISVSSWKILTLAITKSKE